MILNNLGNHQLYKMREHTADVLCAYTDGSLQYCSSQTPELGETVTIRFRTLRAFAAKVTLITEWERIPMEEAEQKNGFTYFEASFVVSAKITRYYFEMEIPTGRRFQYGKNKLVNEMPMADAFELIAGFDIPAWARGTQMYQIFTDRFCNGDPFNDVQNGEYEYLGRPVRHVEDWNRLPEAFDVCNFYGGDLKGVEDKLDYLQSLGVEVIYFNPLFVSPSNHKYDAQDYDHIDPHLGRIVNDYEPSETEPEKDAAYIKRVTDPENLAASDAFFAHFVQMAHRKGMKVILDGVFNHCGSFHKWMDREGIYHQNKRYENGAFWSRESKYRNYFYFDDEDNAYSGWWNHDTLPKLRYEKGSPLYEAILDIGRKWVSPPFCADGWRLDVAADLGNDIETNRMFWRDFRKAVKEANPDALILAEHYGDASGWLDGTMWDSVMNYDAFMEPVSWFLTGMEKHSDHYNQELKNNVPFFWSRMQTVSAKLPYVSLCSAMNELSNHDHSRFLTRTNSRCGRVAQLGPEAASQGINPAVMRAAVVILFTWIGNPTIYYGDEAGLCGFTDPDNRRSYPWGREDMQMLEFHRDIAQIYHAYPMLRTASLTRLACDNDLLLAYSRFTDDEQMIVIINNTEEVVSSSILLWQAGILGDTSLQRLLCSYETGYDKLQPEYKVTDGAFDIRISSHSTVLFYHRNEAAVWTKEQEKS